MNDQHEEETLLLNAAHVKLARTLLDVTCTKSRLYEVLPPPSLTRVWAEIRAFGTLLTEVLVSRGYDAVLDVNPGQEVAEITLPIVSPTMPTVDLIIRYCYIHIKDDKPLYQFGVESEVTSTVYNYAMEASYPTIDKIPEVMDWVRTTRQCRQCYFNASNGMYCGKGLVADGYCTEYKSNLPQSFPRPVSGL